MVSKTKSGFTLIELLVVIAIIGILAGMVLVSMNGARSKARDARRMSDMRQLISAQEMYYGSNASGSDAYVQSATYPGAIGVYLATTPQDPTTGTQANCPNLAGPTYGYCALDNHDAANSQVYCYYTRLENNVGGRTNTFYTASQGGNFYRKDVPTDFTGTASVGCAASD